MKELIISMKDKYITEINIRKKRLYVSNNWELGADT